MSLTPNNGSFIGGTKITSTDKKAVTYGKNRVCPKCGHTMAMYQPDDICWACQRKRTDALIANTTTTADDYMGLDKRGHGHKPRHR